MTRVGKRRLPDVDLHAEDRFPHFNVVAKHMQHNNNNDMLVFLASAICMSRTNQWGIIFFVCSLRSTSQTNQILQREVKPNPYAMNLCLAL